VNRPWCLYFTFGARLQSGLESKKKGEKKKDDDEEEERKQK